MEIEDFYKKNQIKNIIFLHEYAHLNALLAKNKMPEFVPLKGISLLNSIYSPGERPLTDIDVYWPYNIKNQLQTLLESHGYKMVPENTWKYNQHKQVFIKSGFPLDITLEVHYQILPSDIQPWFINSKNQLDPNDEFLYLCYHWAQQHTCLKFFWLIDLYLYYKKHPTVFSTENWQKAKVLKIEKSLLAAAISLNQVFAQNISHAQSKRSYIFKKILTRDTLMNLEQRYGTYLFLKHLLKENWQEALVYNLLWIFHFLQKQKIHS